jgi:hypothetical protein
LPATYSKMKYASPVAFPASDAAWIMVNEVSCKAAMYLAVRSRSPPDRASAVPYGQAGENAMRFPHLAHRSAAAHKLHSTPQQDRMNLISGKGETSSRLPALIISLFLPGSCPNNRNRRRTSATISMSQLWRRERTARVPQSSTEVSGTCQRAARPDRVRSGDMLLYQTTSCGLAAAAVPTVACDRVSI